MKKDSIAKGSEAAQKQMGASIPEERHPMYSGGPVTMLTEVELPTKKGEKTAGSATPRLQVPGS